jgi:cytochrome c
MRRAGAFQKPRSCSVEPEVRRLGPRAALAIAGPGAAVLCIAAAPPAGSAARGEILYEAKCGGCHSLDSNRIGPAHRGVVGRQVASARGYEYSPAIRRLRGVWTPARLDAWLAGPQQLAPGSRMFLTVSNRMERQDIIAYLAAASHRPVSGK